LELSPANMRAQKSSASHSLRLSIKAANVIVKKKKVL